MSATEPENNPYIRITGLDNAFEAQLIASILTDRQIPHRIRSHHDTAYDGLFQMQKGWGELFAPARWKKEITEIRDQIRQDAGSYENQQEGDNEGRSK